MKTSLALFLMIISAASANAQQIDVSIRVSEESRAASAIGARICEVVNRSFDLHGANCSLVVGRVGLDGSHPGYLPGSDESRPELHVSFQLLEPAQYFQNADYFEGASSVFSFIQRSAYIGSSELSSFNLVTAADAPEDIVYWFSTLLLENGVDSADSNPLVAPVLLSVVLGDGFAIAPHPGVLRAMQARGLGPTDWPVCPPNCRLLP